VTWALHSVVVIDARIALKADGPSFPMRIFYLNQKQSLWRVKKNLLSRRVIANTTKKDAVNK